MSNLVRHAALAVLAVGSFLACDQQNTTLKIGAVVPLSGDNSGIGQSLRQGYCLAVDEWNARGGILGHRIELLIADDMGDAVEGAGVCARLVEQDKVAALFGPAMSGVALTGAVIAQAGRVPMITPTASSPKVTEVGNYIFRTCFTDPLQGALGANFAYDDLGARKAACLFDASNDYSKGLANFFLASFFLASFAGRGGQIVGNEVYTPGRTDFRAHLTRIVSTQPDVIYLPGYATDVALIAKEVRRLGFGGPLLGGDGWDSARLLRIGGDAMVNGFYTTHCAKDTSCPMIRAYVKKHLAKYKTHPDAFAMLAYDTCYVLMDAISRAGVSDPRGIRNALEQTNFHAISGQIKFDRQRNPQKPVSIMEIRKGQLVLRRTIEPASSSRLTRIAG